MLRFYEKILVSNHLYTAHEISLSFVENYEYLETVCIPMFYFEM